MAWTNWQIGELKRLWLEGLSTAEIGRQIGMTKNAVIGKSHRIALSPRPSPIRQRLPGAPRPAPRRSAVAMAPPRPTPEAPPAPAEAAPSNPEPESSAGKVVDITGPRCAWPIGDPREADFHFCGRRALASKPYCTDHYAIAYIPGTGRKGSVNAA